MAERRPRHRESAQDRILREHDETYERASRSSSRGKEAIGRAQATREGVR